MSGGLDIAGRVALITGASRGIGRACAEALASAGCRVAVVCRERLAEAQGAAGAIGAGAAAFAADVSRAEEAARVVAEVEAALGPVDILVNNAGISRPQPLEAITEADWDELLTVNLKSAFLMYQAVAPGMAARGFGRLIAIGSIASQTGGLVGPHYAAGKAGLVGLMHSYASRLFKVGVTANAVAPALVVSDMVPDTPELAARVPVGRLGRPEEVADVVLMLARNDYVTGQTISVNGGLHFTS